MMRPLFAAILCLTISTSAWGQWATDAAATGNLRFTWIHGSLSAKANTDVRIQVHRYNEHTYILRQNPAVHWEAPFMYLLMGDKRAVLLDAGATAEADYFPLRNVVDQVLTRWQQANKLEDLELIVMPMGAAASQTAGQEQFSDRINTQIIAADDTVRKAVLGANWPATGTLDLGGRVLEVIATPGIDAQALTVHDPWAKILFTGNTFYPGRLVIRDFMAYLDSMQRLVDLSRDNDIHQIWGGRIEMTAEPGLDFMLRSNYRPNERQLQLSTDALTDALNIVRLINGDKGIHIHDDFIVMHGVGRGARAYGWPVYIPEMFRKDRTR
ncbi:MAG: MBL fold metallo-hydrolase [Pseudomonadota bacterium]|nr:MBL fold metallo-hydrolase [Pseudomonadota bacterium]